MSVPIKQVAKTLEKCGPLFRALGDPFRRQIIMLLAEVEELAVRDIAARVDLSRPAVSHHLKVLLQGRLVAVRREGTENYYSLAMDDALALLKRFVDEVENCEP